MLYLKKLISISVDSKKLWMTSFIQKSICIKDKRLNKLINKKDFFCKNSKKHKGTSYINETK